MSLSEEKMVLNLLILYQKDIITRKEFEEKLDKISKEKKKETPSDEMLILYLEELYQFGILSKEENEAKKKRVLKAKSQRLDKIKQKYSGEFKSLEQITLETFLDMSEEEYLKIFEENLKNVKDEKKVQELKKLSKEEKIKFVREIPQPKKKNSSSLASTLIKSIMNNKDEKNISPKEVPFAKPEECVGSPVEKTLDSPSTTNLNKENTSGGKISSLLQKNRKLSTLWNKTFDKKPSQPSRPNLKISAPTMIEDSSDIHDKNVSDQELSATIVKMSQSLDEKAQQNILELTKEQKLIMVQLQKEKEEKLAKVEASKQGKISSSISRDYNGVILNFMSILTVPDIQESFMKHLELESNKEPLEFFVESDKIIKKPTPKNVQLFFQIVNDYVKIGSRKELNLSGASRTKLLSKIENMDKENWTIKEHPRQLIEDIRQEIFTDLKFDSFPRFIQSDIGYEAICRNKDNPLVVSKNPSSAVLFKLQKSFHGSGEEDIEGIDFTVISEKLSNPKQYKENYLFTKNYSKEELKNFSVKILIVGNNKQSALDQGIRSYLSKNFSNSIRGEHYHSVLMVGPFYFEWDENELCIPKILPPETKLVTEDLDNILVLKNIDENLHLLSETICKWNVKKSFLKSGKDKTIGGNSQDFVESLLAGMGIETQLPLLIQEFLKSIKEKGSTDLEFKMDKNFRSKFKIKEKSIIFETHKQLDEFTKKFLKIDSKFMKNHSAEYQLLKLFDRAFWLKHLSLGNEIVKKNEKLTDLTKERLNIAIKKPDNSFALIDQLTLQIKDLEKDLKFLHLEDKKIAPLQKEVNDESFDDCPFQVSVKTGSN